MRDQSAYSKHRQIPFTNDSGEVIPAFGAVEITGADTDGVLTVTKPTSGVKDYLLASNGHHDVAIGEKGSLTYANPGWVLYDSGSPANGERWASKSSTFKLELRSPETGPFMILGGANGTRVFCGPPHCDCFTTSTTTTTTTTTTTGTTTTTYPISTNCTSCPDGIAADQFSLTVSGISSVTCASGMCEQWNGTWCLVNTSNCDWREDTEIYACATGIQCGGWNAIWRLTIAGGTVTVTANQAIQFCGNGREAQVTYSESIGSWDCKSPNTIPKTADKGNCTGWPASITIIPSNCI